MGEIRREIMSVSRNYLIFYDLYVKARMYVLATKASHYWGIIGYRLADRHKIHDLFEVYSALLCLDDETKEF